MVQAAELEWADAIRAGDFERAWAVNHRDLARRIATREPKHEGPRHLQHIWRGEPLRDARVLVRCYHGLGDTLQFIRFAAPLRRIARAVIVWAQPELVDLVARAPGIDRVLPLHDGTPEIDYDVDIEIMELAFALRVSRGEIESSVPYLVAPRASRRPARLAPGLVHVGLVCRAGDWDRRRSVDVSHLAAFSRLFGVRLHLLQPPAGDDGALPCGTTSLWRPHIRDAAAILAELDLVITVDTMMAHLAGAMGRPVWTMLCRDCDWRWGIADTTPWYPTMRLFRQTQAGDWAPVIETLTRRLERFVRERTKERHGMREVWKQKNLR
jgi:hypothetical protein